METTKLQLRQIYEDLISVLDHQRYGAEYANSLFKGPWGALLFMFYYEQYVDTSADHAAGLLEKLYAAYTPEEGINYSFCSGHTGPYWLLEHLSRRQFLDMDLAELAGDFVTATIAHSNLNLQWRNFDFLHGSIGMCNFLLPFAARHDVRKHLSDCVDHLLAASKLTPKGRSLPIFYTHDKPVGEYVDAFSLAHGSCAALILLTKIYAAGISKDTCELLVTECMAFILNNKLAPVPDELNALYPAILDGKYASNNSRLAWCYGDLNVAWTLWYCGGVFNNAAWKKEALDIMHYNIRRNTYEAAGVLDSCLCHGTSGIAAFYRKFWFETGDPAFHECAEYWYGKAASEITFSDELNKHGILVWRGKDKDWCYSWDLLDGGAGVGLALMSRLHEKPLTWDECFLLS